MILTTSLSLVNTLAQGSIVALAASSVFLILILDMALILEILAMASLLHC